MSPQNPMTMVARHIGRVRRGKTMFDIVRCACGSVNQFPSLSWFNRKKACEQCGRNIDQKTMEVSAS